MSLDSIVWCKLGNLLKEEGGAKHSGTPQTDLRSMGGGAEAP